MQHRAKFGVGIGVIVVSLAFLAWLGYGESKTYYHTIAEYQLLQGSARNHRMRIGGTVEPGSIKRSGTHVEFVLVEQDQKLPVVYTGTEAPPDTFKDDSQALAEGSFGRDGVFHAKGLQAKCASKYAPAKAGDAPAQSTM